MSGEQSRTIEAGGYSVDTGSFRPPPGGLATASPEIQKSHFLSMVQEDDPMIKIFED